ncbi:hypothetical protein LOZ80_15185 [Paenibacillus sp. HWE-109]|uniref:hypothetical protein n=1 Tax=Paenibacillus sp. HWE-109 TaxID=1306526 RepID=UPI001EE08D39|nr:hypothetical protein [Paenibacillus sp. HWE-109]UKS30204.1 hypothetical protein LOZ80_15185 [Paenibacillus sp. HWE-109]
MREKLGITLFIAIIALLVIGFLAILALGVTAIVGFAGGSIPFGFAFLVAAALIIAFVMVGVNESEVGVK